MLTNYEQNCQYDKHFAQLIDVLQFVMGRGKISLVWLDYYEKTPIQIYRKFHPQKTENFQIKNSDIFYISAQNINCRYSLEPPSWGCSSENPQSMLLIRNKKNNVYPSPVNPSL